jgi:hypothetical protein
MGLLPNFFTFSKEMCRIRYIIEDEFDHFELRENLQKLYRFSSFLVKKVRSVSGFGSVSGIFIPDPGPTWPKSPGYTTSLLAAQNEVGIVLVYSYQYRHLYLTS